MLYYYRGKVVHIVDGDTFDIVVDLGFNIFHKVRVRLADIDTPEIFGKEKEEGLKVKDFVEKAILNKEVYVHTEKDKKGKYGRYIAHILFTDDKGQVFDLTSVLREQFGGSNEKA